MKHVDRKTLIGLLAVMLVRGPALTRAGAQPLAPGDQSPRQRIAAAHFPNVTLTTQDGRKVKFYDDLIKDKIVVINFMYAECTGVCPGVTANLARVQKLLKGRVGRDIFFYSITLKPELDSPEKLKAYAAMHGAGPGWLFLTGAPGDIELLRRSLGFTYPDPKEDADKSNHIGNLRYGNEALMQWAACPGLVRPGYIAESIGWVDWPKESKGEKGGNK
jgi:protein SCO1